jgi:hypothetical protein
MATKLEKYNSEMNKFMKDYFNVEKLEDRFFIDTKEVGKVRILPTMNDYHKPYTYTLFMQFDEPLKAKEMYGDGVSSNGKYNFHGLMGVDMVKHVLVREFGNLTLVE